MGNGGSKLKQRMTIRRRRNSSDAGDEYSAVDIRLKYENMPTVTAQERMIIKSSWRILKTNVIQKHGKDFFINTYDSQFKPPIGVTPVFRNHGQKILQIVAKVVDSLQDGMEPSDGESQEIWDYLIEHGKLYLGYGALPMYFDVMGTNFVIAVRGSMGGEWYEALEYHWLTVFNVISYCMKFAWNLQRAEEQKKASQMSKKRQLGFTQGSDT